MADQLFETFLGKVAELVLEKSGHELEKTVLVTPNRRAALFLKKYIAQKINRAIWAPDIITSENFIAHLSGLSIQDPMALLLDFYQIYAESEADKAEPMEEFLKWAPVLIRDFSDIDASLPDPRQIFNNVLDIKKMEAWNPDGTPPTEYQQKYIAFFRKFDIWHQQFTEALLARKQGYQGLAARVAAKNSQALAHGALPWKKVWFVGFNALSQAEETIFTNLSKAGIAEIIWDADKYYLDNTAHEAGFFLRRYRQMWGINNFSFTGDHFSIRKKSIQVYGVAKNVNQAKLVAGILKDLPAESFENHQTAIVLASEDLLLPVLNSLPENIRKVNVTMGYPIRKINIYALFDTIFQMHITTVRMKSAAEGLASAFYYKDIVKLLQHPAMALMLNQQTPEISPDTITNKIYLSRRTFISFRAIADMSGQPETMHQLLAPLFTGYHNNPSGILATLKGLIVSLSAMYELEATKSSSDIHTQPWYLDYEALQATGNIIRKLELFCMEHKAVDDLKVLFMIFQSVAREMRLNLSGEPLEGLQIMGLLETRNIDFKNLIILSANEDILPASKSNNSLIPFDVRAHFGIPVHREKDAIFAYHFYRLLQRAENIHIVYNTQTQDMGSSEKSRYITQLQMEMPAWNPNIAINEMVIPLPPASDQSDHEITIGKTSAIQEQIEKINNNGFSPTTLSHYIRCSLLFYFRHIAGISESIAPEETIQANTLGSVIHETLEQLYADEGLPGKIIQADHIDRMIGRTDTVTAEKFAQIYEGGPMDTGKNLLMSRVAARFVRNYLLHEKQLVEKLKQDHQFLQYIKSEERLTTTIPIEMGDGTREVRFNGFADRIDNMGGVLRIIDYKTGKVDGRELIFREWEDIVSKADLGKSFQLLMYAMLYARIHGTDTPISPGIISLRRPSAGMLTLTSPSSSGTVDNATLESFEEQLKKIMQEIFDPRNPFIRTTDENNCINCDFRVVCNR